MEKEGMEVGPMALGMFQTKNGLKYPGLIATSDIQAHSVLLRVPVGSLLTTRDAYLSPIQKYTLDQIGSLTKTPSSSPRRSPLTGRTDCF